MSGLEEKVIDGVLHWRESEEAEFIAYTPEHVTRRLLVAESAMRAKNTRIKTLCDHIDELQKIITDRAGIDVPAFGQLYMNSMKRSNIQKAGG
jgi:hypothetical protein